MDNTQTLIVMAAAIGIVVGAYALFKILSRVISEVSWRYRRVARLEERIDKINESLYGRNHWDYFNDYVAPESLSGRVEKLEKARKRAATNTVTKPKQKRK